MKRNRIKISPSEPSGPHVSLCQIDTNSNYASRNRNELKPYSLYSSIALYLPALAISNPLTRFFDLVGCMVHRHPRPRPGPHPDPVCL